MVRAFLYLLFINILDYLTTAYMISKQGVNVELNVWLVYLIQLTNTTFVILAFKLLFITSYAVSMFILYKTQPKRFANPFWTWVVYFFNISYTFVVLASVYTISITQ